MEPGRTPRSRPPQAPQHQPLDDPRVSNPYSDTGRRRAVQGPRSRPSHMPSDEDKAGLDVFGNVVGPARLGSRSDGRASFPPGRAAAPRTPLPHSGETPGPRMTLQLPSVTESAAMPAERAPTLTERLRNVAPPDVARQAINELGILARELHLLPGRLESAGMAHSHQRAYLDTTRSYLDLAQTAWESIAEERLEQSGAEPTYREKAVGVARQITRMQRESRAVEDEGSGEGGGRPLFWRQRTQLVENGLESWMATLGVPADPLQTGRGLFRLRGYLGLANASGFELLLFNTLLRGMNAAGGFLVLGLLTLMALALVAGAEQTMAAIAFSLASLLVTIVWTLGQVLTVSGRAPLRLLLGASLYSARYSARNGAPGGMVAAVLLRGWSILVQFAGVVALLVSLGYTGMLVAGHFASPLPSDQLAMIRLIAESLVTLTAPAGAICLVALLLLALPLLLVSQVRFWADLAGNRSWVPAGRRYALRPSVSILGFLSLGLVIALYLGATALGLDTKQWALFVLASPSFTGMLTVRAAILLAGVVLPYLLVVEVPFRLGLRRWRQLWLGDLIARRAAAESHMRRLSATDPQSRTQDTSDENLRAMQYDLVLLQFYRNKIEEAQAVRARPFSLQTLLGLLLSGILLAMAVDFGGTILQQFLPQLLDALMK